MKDYFVTAPSIKEVYKNPWLIFTTFFGAGCLTPGPGTWGSFAAWLAFLILEPLGGRGLMWILTILCFIVGVIAIPKCEAVLKKMDHGSIVIDEVVAVWFVLLLCPTGLFWQLAGVLVFRFFDIVKLPPAAGLDNGLQSGWTVMIDDVFAALYTLLVVNGVAWLLVYFLNAELMWKVF